MSAGKYREAQRAASQRYRRKQARRRQWLNSLAREAGLSVEQLTTETMKQRLVQALLS